MTTEQQPQIRGYFDKQVLQEIGQEWRGVEGVDKMDIFDLIGLYHRSSTVVILKELDGLALSPEDLAFENGRVQVLEFVLRALGQEEVVAANERRVTTLRANTGVIRSVTEVGS